MSAAKRPPTEAELAREIDARGLRPCAFQALWDGDSRGWFICLETVVADEGPHGPRYRAVPLTFLRLGGDIRLFTGEVPPWPEARLAAELGEALARRHGVPFYFPSPRDPDDDCPNWWDQDRAIHCADCDKLIIPTESPHLPKDICHHCHSAREAMARIRRDEPASPDGVTMLLSTDDGFRRVAYSDKARYLAVPRVALDDPMWAHEARERGELVLAGRDLLPIEARLRAEIKERIERLPPPAAPKKLHAFQEWCTVVFEGRRLELEVRFDSDGRELHSLIEYLDMVRHTIERHATIRLVFRRGMTARGDHLIRRVRGRGPAPTAIALLVGECRGTLDEGEIRAALTGLQEFGYVAVDADEVRLTERGRHVCM